MDIISIKTKKEGNFTVLSLDCINDNNLSWKAKGLHTYLISRPPGWKIRRADLIKKSTDGRISVLSAVNELKQHSYVYMIQERDLSGKIMETSLYILEKPDQNYIKLEEELNKDIVDKKFKILPFRSRKK
jgi:hypothetical protein